jgi:type II secretory pathway component PulL
MEKTRRSLRLTLALIIILTLVFTADMALKITTVKKEASYIENEILKTYSGIFPGEKLQGSQGLIYRMKSHLKEMKDKDRIFSGVSPLELLLKLGELKLTTLTEITLEKDLIVLKGEASSLSEVQQIKTRLETMFSDVKVSDTSQSAQNKIAFTITAKEKEA